MTFEKVWSCSGKKRYKTFNLAEKGMKNLVRYKREVSVHVYRCEHCQKFHVGHVGQFTKRRKYVQTKV